MRNVGFLSNMALGEMYGFDDENVLKVLNAILKELKELRKEIRGSRYEYNESRNNTGR